jgi:hypothetical protein
MNLKNFVIIILLILFSVSGSDAQKWKLRRYEGIAGIGTAHYFGDIGGTADEHNLFGIKDIELFNTRPSFYIGARYKIRHNMAVKTNFIFGFLKGDDEGKYPESAYNRQCWFTSEIFELSAQFEFSIISEEHRYRTNAMFNKRGMINNYSNYNVYIFTGVGGVFAWPHLHNYHEWYFPETGMKMGLTFPIGLGMKYVMSSNLSIGVEFGGRFTTTDLLDNYHIDYASKANDIYYFAVFNAIYRVKTSRRGFPVIGRRRASFL